MKDVWVVLILAGALLAPRVAGAETVRVISDRVDVQRETSPGGGILGTVPKGTVLQVLGRDAGWVQVALPIGNGAFYAGFIPAVYCQAAPGAAPSPGPLASGGPPPQSPAPAPAPAPAAVQAPAAPAAVPAPVQASPVAPAAEQRPASPPPPRSEAISPSPVRRTALEPENRQRREGFWIGVGLGYGSYKGCDDYYGCGDREGSFSGYLKLGGTLNRQVLLGVESTGWTKNEGGAQATVGAFTGTVTFYPVLSSGFFLKAGAGLSYVELAVSSGAGTVTVSKTGWGLTGGLGYDVRVARNISITPALTYAYGRTGDLDVLIGTRGDLLQVAVGVTFH